MLLSKHFPAIKSPPSGPAGLKLQRETCQMLGSLYQKITIDHRNNGVTSEKERRHKMIRKRQKSKNW